MDRYFVFLSEALVIGRIFWHLLAFLSKEGLQLGFAHAFFMICK
jgi:hypothetical protein